MVRLEIAALSATSSTSEAVCAESRRWRELPLLTCQQLSKRTKVFFIAKVKELTSLLRSPPQTSGDSADRPHRVFFCPGLIFVPERLPQWHVFRASHPSRARDRTLRHRGGRGHITATFTPLEPSDSGRGRFRRCGRTDRAHSDLENRIARERFPTAPQPSSCSS